MLPVRPSLLVIGALLLALGMQTFNLYRTRSELATLRAEVAAGKLVAAEMAANKERTWARDKQELEDANRTLQAELARDRAAADAAAERLHDLARQRAARPCRATSPAGGGPTPEAPDYLLSELFASADRRAGELAEVADTGRAAHAACVGAYEALRRFSDR